MAIRHITAFDKPYIFHMLRNYRDTGAFADVEFGDNEEYISRMLDHIIAGAGVALVSEVNDKITGCLIAIKTPHIWNPDIFTLNELVYWVEPQYRGGSHGYRLLKEYVNIGQQFKALGWINNFTISRRAGTEYNYHRFGFKPQDENWSQ